mmetsp:Transcript_49749/g.50135  ORF Transcript_49749/g.50135 Transcript_49749/m.50135 type:complete len:213 (+) Transcript_49749:605-1243(+)
MWEGEESGSIADEEERHERGDPSSCFRVSCAEEMIFIFVAMGGITFLGEIVSILNPSSIDPFSCVVIFPASDDLNNAASSLCCSFILLSSLAGAGVVLLFVEIVEGVVTFLEKLLLALYIPSRNSFSKAATFPASDDLDSTDSITGGSLLFFSSSVVESGGHIAALTRADLVLSSSSNSVFIVSTLETSIPNVSNAATVATASPSWGESKGV